MTKLEEELQFLKNFRQRFTSTATYRAAIEDMWREGMITPKAYKQLNMDKLVPKKALIAPIKKVTQEAVKLLKEDPCGQIGSKITYGGGGCSGNNFGGRC